jgi:hypothetical protein
VDNSLVVEFGKARKKLCHDLGEGTVTDWAPDRFMSGVDAFTSRQCKLGVTPKGLHDDMVMLVVILLTVPKGFKTVDNPGGTFEQAQNGCFMDADREPFVVETLDSDFPLVFLVESSIADRKVSTPKDFGNAIPTAENSASRKFIKGICFN